MNAFKHSKSFFLCLLFLLWGSPQPSTWANDTTININANNNLGECDELFCPDTGRSGIDDKLKQIDLTPKKSRITVDLPNISQEIPLERPLPEEPVVTEGTATGQQQQQGTTSATEPAATAGTATGTTATAEPAATAGTATTPGTTATGPAGRATTPETATTPGPATGTTATEPAGRAATTPGTQAYSTSSNFRGQQQASRQKYGSHKSDRSLLNHRGNPSQIKGSRLKGSIHGVSQQAGDIHTEGGANSYTNLAFLNKQNRLTILKDNTDSNNNTKRRGGQALRASRPGGSFRSKSPSLGKGSVSRSGKTQKPKGFFSKLASSLGLGRYFGSTGSRRSGGSYHGSGTYNNQRKREALAQNQNKEKLKTPADILRERFNRHMKRGVAHSLEFETPKTSLFQKMCEHYDHYTRTNNIPDNRKYCPQ